MPASGSTGRVTPTPRRTPKRKKGNAVYRSVTGAARKTTQGTRSVQRKVRKTASRAPSYSAPPSRPIKDPFGTIGRQAFQKQRRQAKRRRRKARRKMPAEHEFPIFPLLDHYTDRQRDYIEKASADALEKIVGEGREPNTPQKGEHRQFYQRADPRTRQSMEIAAGSYKAAHDATDAAAYRRGLRQGSYEPDWDKLTRYEAKQLHDDGKIYVQADRASAELKRIASASGAEKIGSWVYVNLPAAERRNRRLADKLARDKRPASVKAQAKAARQALPTGKAKAGGKEAQDQKIMGIGIEAGLEALTERTRTAGLLNTPLGLAQAFADNPGEFLASTKRTAIESVLGIPEGVKMMIDDPKGAVKAMADDYSRRYGPLVEGDVKTFSHRATTESGATPFLFDALTLAPIAGQALGAAGRIAAAGGSKAYLARVTMRNRPNLRIGAGSGAVRRQSTSGNLFRAIGQDLMDRSRRSGYQKRLQKHGLREERAQPSILHGGENEPLRVHGGGPTHLRAIDADKGAKAYAGLRPGPNEVVPRWSVRNLPGVRAVLGDIERDIGARKSRARVRMLNVANRVEHEIRKHIGRLNSNEKRGLKYVMQLGLKADDLDAADRLLGELEAKIVKERDGVIDEETGERLGGITDEDMIGFDDELEAIRAIREDLDKFVTPRTRLVADQLDAIERREVGGDPGVKQDVATVRRVNPIAELLGLSRRGHAEEWVGYLHGLESAFSKAETPLPEGWLEERFGHLAFDAPNKRLVPQDDYEGVAKVRREVEVERNKAQRDLRAAEDKARDAKQHLKTLRAHGERDLRDPAVRGARLELRKAEKLRQQAVERLARAERKGGVHEGRPVKDKQPLKKLPPVKAVRDMTDEELEQDIQVLAGHMEAPRRADAGEEAYRARVEGLRAQLDERLAEQRRRAEADLPEGEKVLQTSPNGTFQLRETAKGRYYVWDVKNGERMADIDSTGSAGGLMRELHRAEDRFNGWAYQDVLDGPKERLVVDLDEEVGDPPEAPRQHEPPKGALKKELRKAGIDDDITFHWLDAEKLATGRHELEATPVDDPSITRYGKAWKVIRRPFMRPFVKTVRGKKIPPFDKTDDVRFYDERIAEVSGHDPVTGRPIVKLKEDTGWVDLDAMNESDPKYLYRGISKAELDDIRATGRIKSNGSYNLGGGQDNMTIFSSDLGQAAHYAGGFAPNHLAPTFAEPGYVIKVVRPKTDATPDSMKATTEVYVADELPERTIVEVWEVRAFTAAQEKFDIYPASMYGERGMSHRATGFGGASNGFAYKRVDNVDKTLKRKAHPEGEAYEARRAYEETLDAVQRAADELHEALRRAPRREPQTIETATGKVRRGPEDRLADAEHAIAEARARLDESALKLDAANGVYDDVKNQRVRGWEPADDFERRVVEEAIEQGLTAPAYWKSTAAPSGSFASLKAVGGFRANAAPKQWSGALFRTGRESADPEVFVEGVLRNIKRRYNWNLVATNIEHHAEAWSRGQSGAGMTAAEIVDYMRRNNLNRDGFQYVNVGKLYKFEAGLEEADVVRLLQEEGGAMTDVVESAVRREMEGDLLNPDQEGLGVPRQMWDEIVEALQASRHRRQGLESEALQLERGAFQGQPINRYLVVPNRVMEELEAVTKYQGAAFRVWDLVFKSMPSRVLLGFFNVSWLAFQVAANGLLAGLGGVRPFDIIGAYRWWKTLTPEEQEGFSSWVGIGYHHQRDVPHIGGAPDPTSAFGKFVYGWRAIKKTTFGRELFVVKGRQVTLSKMNPLDLFFRADQAQNNFFRKTLLYKQVQRERYGRMNAATRGMAGIQAKTLGTIDNLATKGDNATLSRWLLRPENQRMLEKHAEHVNEFLGDYVTYTARERAFLGRSLMFYGYLRFSLRFAFWTMPVNHPIQLSIMGRIGQLGANEIKQLLGVERWDELPASVVAQMFFGSRQDFKNERGGAINFGRMNPFGNMLVQMQSPTQVPGMMSPILQMVIDQATTSSGFTDKEWTREGHPYQQDQPKGYYGSMWSLLDPSLLTGEASYRQKVALQQGLSLLPPYNVARETGIPFLGVDPMRGPQSSESNLFNQVPLEFSNRDKRGKEINRSIRRGAKREEDFGTGNWLLSELLPMVKPQPTPARQMLQREIEKREEFYKARKKKGKGKSSSSSGSSRSGGRTTRTSSRTSGRS